MHQNKKENIEMLLMSKKNLENYRGGKRNYLNNGFCHEKLPCKKQIQMSSLSLLMEKNGNFCTNCC